MNQEDTGFDFQEASQEIQGSQQLLGKGGILTLLIKNLTETALEAEQDPLLGQELIANQCPRYG